MSSSHIRPLSPDQLYTSCDLSEFKFQSTDDIDAVVQTVGQEKAVDALHFGMNLQHEGYNIFVLGPPGSGKFSTVMALLRDKAKDQPLPDDWCYVYNFDVPHKPKAICLPCGEGKVFADDMENMIDALRQSLFAVFNSDEYQSQVHALEHELKDQEEQAIETIRQEAREHGIALIRTSNGFAFAAIHEGEALKPREYEHLPAKQRVQIEARINELEKKLQKVINQVPQWRNETREKIKTLVKSMAAGVVRYPLSRLKKRYGNTQQIIQYLDRVERDVLDNIEEFRFAEEEEKTPGYLDISHSTPFYRYKVNVLVTNGHEGSGAPVVYEDHPTYQNLVGRIEHISMMGALLTDFRLIKPGALHRATQGFLVLDAYKILSHAHAWEGLKRALQSKEIRIQSLEQWLSLASTVSLEPECIPLNTKVILLGDRYLYYLLHQLDPEFCELFKVAADFEESVQRIPENISQYVSLISTLSKKRHLRGLDPQAVACVIEHCSRMIEDAERLSTHLRSITDLLIEADFWASEREHSLIERQDVEQAILAREQRSSRIKSLHLEAIRRGMHIIDTQGERVGVVNGLTVMFLGDTEFGTPTRITATVRMGEGDVINIEREVELSGPIHSKGVFILSSYLSSHYAVGYPLSLSANVAFEQSYSMIEGDSASAAELFALLSAIAQIPIRQNIAVTGSINQLGEVQAIGGVNHKIEGFFDACKLQGLNGEQGVVIPKANVQHLMLRRDVIDAVRAEQFHIYAIENVNQGLEVLTGSIAGERDEHGSYPEQSVNWKVEQRLTDMAKNRHDFSSVPKDEADAIINIVGDTGSKDE